MSEDTMGLKTTLFPNKQIQVEPIDSRRNQSKRIKLTDKFIRFCTCF